MLGSLRRRAVRFAGIACVAAAVAVAVATVAVGPAAHAAARSSTPTSKPTVAVSPSARTGAAPAGAALRVTVPVAHVLTLPAHDGFHDSLRVRVTGKAGWKVDVAAVNGSKTVLLAHRVTLKRSATDVGVSVTVHVRLLTAGHWRIRVVRVGHTTTRSTAATRVVVGTGHVTHVAVTPDEHTYYPYRDGYRDSVHAAVVATDETGTPLPLRGTLELRRGATSHVVRLAAAGADVSTVGMLAGTATLVAHASGPAGASFGSAPVPLTLRTTGVASVRIAASIPTVDPVIDGQLDSVTLTASGTATPAIPIRASGTLSITRDADGARAMSATLKSIATTELVWDGRIGGAVVPGSYTATVVLHGVDGVLRSASTRVTVSADHLDYRAQNLFEVQAGNQQGLAVHDGTFYVATDLGNGSSRIDEYNASGAVTGSLGILPIGHAATLSYSTTNGMLYASNGGMVANTMVYAIDPAAADPAATMQQFDLSSFGPNGMVAVDDANQRLVVFAGTPGAYTVSLVGLDASAVSPSPMPVTIDGLPQGIEVVNGEIWIFTSSATDNRIERFTLDGDAITPVGGADGVIPLAWHGEGEGLAYDPTATPPPGTTSPVPGVLYIGAHSANRVGELVAVTVG